MSSSMSVQGQLLELTIMCCRNLKDTEWISRQDPYVIIEYANNKFRTKTHTDGGKNPIFHEKYTIPLIEGLREINVQVWNSNTLSADDFIGSGKIFLQKVLSSGYDNSSWALSSHRGKRSGEIEVVMHYSIPKEKQSAGFSPSPSYNVPPFAPPSYHAPPYTASAAYPPDPSAGQIVYPPIYSAYPPVRAPYAGPSTYGPGGYPPYGSQPPPAYPNAYPPQPGYGAPPSGYPNYQGGRGY